MGQILTQNNEILSKLGQQMLNNVKKYFLLDALFVPDAFFNRCEPHVSKQHIIWHGVYDGNNEALGLRGPNGRD